jgi:hypothetical protein
VRAFLVWAILFSGWDVVARGGVDSAGCGGTRGCTPGWYGGRLQRPAGDEVPRVWRQARRPATEVAANGAKSNPYGPEGLRGLRWGFKRAVGGFLDRIDGIWMDLQEAIWLDGRGWPAAGE